MNLEQALNYHKTCIICQKEMEIKSPDLVGVHLTSNEDGLEVKTGHKDIAVFFCYNGTYHKMKKWNPLYAKPLQVMVECPVCVPTIELEGTKVRVEYKSRGIGATTLAHSKDLHFAYQFSLFGDDDGSFKASLDWEDIKFFNKRNFYHINTKFESSYTFFLHGRQDANRLGGYDVDSMRLPSITTGGVSSIDQLLNKLKLYNVFS